MASLLRLKEGRLPHALTDSGTQRHHHHRNTTSATFIYICRCRILNLHMFLLKKIRFTIFDGRKAESRPVMKEEQVDLAGEEEYGAWEIGASGAHNEKEKRWPCVSTIDCRGGG